MKSLCCNQLIIFQTQSLGKRHFSFFNAFLKSCLAKINIIKGYLLYLLLLIVLAEVVLGNPCYVDNQCFGTPDSTICAPDRNNQLRCQCNSGFIEHQNKYIQGIYAFSSKIEFSKTMQFS